MKTKGLLVAFALVSACRSSTESDAGRRGPARRGDVPLPPPAAAPELRADPSGAAAAALRAAMGNLPAATPIPSPLLIDLDGDQAFELLSRSEERGCFVASRQGGAWRGRALGVEVGNNDDDVRCLDPIGVGRRTLLAATGGGMVRDPATSAVSSTSVGVTLWGIAGGELRALWSDEVAEAQNDDGYQLSTLGDGVVLVSRKAQGATSYRVLTLTPEGGIAARSCWDTAQPRVVPTAPTGCTARPAQTATLSPLEGGTTGVRVDLGDTGALAVLQPGTATRDGARAFCVAAPTGDVTGYVFLRPEQLQGCPAFPPPPARAPAR